VRAELRDRPHCVAHRRRELLGRGPGAEAEDPLGEIGIGRFEQVAVQLEERQHRDERQALVGVDERLALGDAVRQDGGLQGDIGLFVVGVAARPGESALENVLVAKLIGGLRGRAADDRRYSSSASTSPR
jgi:hypothetical protein